MVDLEQRAASALEAALAGERGRSVELIIRDGPLRQSIVALRAGTALPEHESPDGATIQVLIGHLAVTGPQGSAPSAAVRAGELAPLPHPRHAVDAMVDSVFLLTVASGSLPD